NEQTRQNEAHIQFYYEEDAQEAIQHLNGKMIQGQNIEIEFQSVTGRQSPPLQNNPRPPLPIPQQPTQEEDQKTLYITNLNSRTTQQDLELVFLGFNVARSRLIPGQTYTQPSSAEVHFLSDKDAHQALMHSKDLKIDNNMIEIRYKILPPPQFNRRQIQIKNLDPSTNKRTLELIFKPFSPIDINMNTPQPGQAQIKFTYDEDGEESLNLLNGRMIQGSRISIEFQQIPGNILQQSNPRPPFPITINPTEDKDSKSLIITNIDPVITKADIELIFMAFNIENFNIKPINPRFETRKGEAFFSNWEDAREALIHVDGQRVSGKEIRIKFNRKRQIQDENPNQIQQSGSTLRTLDIDKKSLFINFLNPATTNSTLTEAFRPFKVINCFIPTGQKGTKIHGFAYFSNETDAGNALQNLNGKKIDGNKVTIKYKQILPPASLPQFNRREIQIKNLDPSTNKRTLELIFKPFSPIDINMNTPQSGQAQIKFTYDEDGEEAKNLLNGKMIQGSRISIEFQQIPGNIPQQQNQRPPLHAPQNPTVEYDSKTLIITNLDPITSEADLSLVFLAFKVASCRIGNNLTGEVTFGAEEDAKQALIHVEGKRVDRNVLHVQYKKKGNSSIQ
ncbi:MAG: hypothetical protein EZS28_035840, partial [Streblomastix strix]